MATTTDDNSFVQEVFSEVPETYERVNAVLTLGMDGLWRRKAARLAAENAKPGMWADMCTGTGETAMYLCRLAPTETKVHAVDFSEPMMAEARKKKEADRIEFVLADVKNLPFPDNHFDLLTISFATRNLNLNKETLTSTFAEFLRVLKPGGLFVNLETSQPSSAIVKAGFHLYTKLFVKQLGSKLSGSELGYSYLSKTIPRFYPAPILTDILKDAGFNKVTQKRLMFGVTAIHMAWKKDE